MEAQGLQQRMHFLQAAAAIDDVCRKGLGMLRCFLSTSCSPFLGKTLRPWGPSEVPHEPGEWRDADDVSLGQDRISLQHFLVLVDAAVCIWILFSQFLVWQVIYYFCDFFPHFENQSFPVILLQVFPQQLVSISWKLCFGAGTELLHHVTCIQPRGIAVYGGLQVLKSEDLLGRAVCLMAPLLE